MTMSARRIPSHPASTLRAAVRCASDAWRSVEAAQQALAHHMDHQEAPQAPPEHVRMQAHLETAKTALRAAYYALVPSPRGRHRMRRVRGERGPTRTLRGDLWRCTYCGGLVWTADRRTHLTNYEHLPDGLWPEDGQLTAHFTAAERPTGDDEDDDD